MKHHSQIFTFAAGMAASALLFTCAAGASASGGGLAFNTTKVILGYSHFAEEGQSLQTASGAEIPATILYTDSQGGGTLYAPMRPMLEAIGAQVSWNSDRNRVEIKLDPSDALYTMNTEYSDYYSISLDCFQEIAPLVPTGGTVLVPVTQHQSTENFHYELAEFDSAQGDCVSVTVTNHGEKPVQSHWGLTKPYGNTVVTTGYMRIPAGGTLTRTIQVIGPVEDQTLYFDIGNAEGMCEACDLEVSVVQFKSDS